ncbi:hypothetical protein LY474_10590 [Myxococcus stipitatus]|uniref:hypothetical protein n=1 Tax=Myxococcus stipitatus TaxID=83455 RepID=UPI001F25E8B0|nr:hypothetical protein [Myxococcus stipitatus]MCE9668262.1 hypothetical protein [Myxococcus stipitatus]
MQLRKMMLVLSALGAMSGLMAGCGDDEPGAAGCTTSADCAGTEICHPTAGVCVTTCESGSDCPESAKTCATLGGTGPDANKKICQCSTDVLCNGGTDSESTDLVCSDLDNVCVPKCGSNSDCAVGRVCNTGTGQCEEDDTTGKTCSGEGLSTCSYGQMCSNSTCSALPTPTCENYTNFANKGALGTTGPILFKAEVAGFATDTSFCPASLPKRVRVRLSAYSNTPFPPTSAELNGLFYVQVNGTTQNASISSSAGNYIVSGANRDRAEIIVNFCRPADSSTTSAGYYFTNGNFLCFQANHQ